MAVYKAKTKIDSSNNMEEVKFPMSVIDGLSEALASGGGITEISDQNVRVWDLSTGIYKLTFNGALYLYYRGATNSANVIIRSSSGETLLLVSVRDATYKDWIVFGGTSYLALKCGYTGKNDGNYTSRVLSNIPAASVVNNLTSTSTTAPLAANQGNVLKGLIDDLTEIVDNISTGGTPIATTTTVGGIKAQSGSSSGQSFPVQVNSDGTAFINIPIYTGGTV